MPTFVYLSFGSNLGDREANLIHALESVKRIEGLDYVSSSSVYISPAVDMPSSAPEFLDMVIKAEYGYRPQELLNALENIESKMGRTGKGKYLPRSIDIDILLFGDEKLATERLTIPHRKLTERPFILVPLLQLEPDLTHPDTGKALSSYLRDKDRKEILMYKESLTPHA